MPSLTHCNHDPMSAARHLNAWLEHAREAMLPMTESEEVLRRTEQRMVVVGLERLLRYPTVADAIEPGKLALHGWHYVIELGKVLMLDVATGQFSD